MQQRTYPPDFNFCWHSMHKIRYSSYLISRQWPIPYESRYTSAYCHFEGNWTVFSAPNGSGNLQWISRHRSQIDDWQRKSKIKFTRERGYLIKNTYIFSFFQLFLHYIHLNWCLQVATRNPKRSGEELIVSELLQKNPKNCRFDPHQRPLRVTRNNFNCTLCFY